jgi:hypothetical protein
MKKFILLIACFILAFLPIRAQEQAQGELIINVINNPGFEIRIVVSLASSLCWDAIGEPGYYDVHDLTNQYPGSYQTTFSNPHLDWEACWSQQYEHMFGLGNYSVSACEPGGIGEEECAVLDYFYIDYRTSDLPENFGGGDVSVDFDVSTKKFYYVGTQNPFPTYTSIWELKNWIDKITTELEPLPPEDLYWYNFFDYPRLQWSHSSNPDDYVTDYEIHRYTGQGWGLIATRPAAFTFYIDWEVDLGAPEQYEYLLYKIRSKNGNRVSDEFSNTIVIYSPGNFGKNSDGINPANEIKYEYKLEQNYPNPFNPSTKITFTLKENSPVRLRIYDVLGKEVAVLVNEVLAEGNHQVEFDGSTLGGGIYFYEIMANNFRDVKKLILLK